MHYLVSTTGFAYATIRAAVSRLVAHKQLRRRWEDLGGINHGWRFYPTENKRTPPPGVTTKPHKRKRSTKSDRELLEMLLKQVQELTVLVEHLRFRHGD